MISSIILISGFGFLGVSLWMETIIYTIIGIILLLLGITLKFLAKQEDIFSPIFIAIGSILLTIIIKALYLYWNKSVEIELFTRGLFYSGIFIITFIVGCLILPAKKIVQNFKVFPYHISKTNLFNLTLFFIFSGLLLYFLLAFLWSGDPLGGFKDPFGFRFFLQRQGMTYIFLLHLFLLSSPLWMWAILIFQKKEKRKMIKVGLLIGFITYVLLLFSTGERGLFFGVIITLLLLYQCVHQPFRLKHLIIIFLLLFFLIIPIVTTYAHYRVLLQREQVELSFFVQQIQTKTFFNMTKDLIESINSFDNFLLVLEEFPYEKDILYGASFLNFFAQPIPRYLFPEKPYPFISEMTRQLKPDVFQVGIVSTFGGLSELYVNFYWVGIIMGGFLFGIIISILNAYYFKEKQNPGFLFWYVQIYMLPLWWLSMGFINSGANVKFIILSLFSLFFLELIKKRNIIN